MNPVVVAFLAAVEALVSVARAIGQLLQAPEEREALFLAAEQLASVHAKLKFPGLREE